MKTLVFGISSRIFPMTAAALMLAVSGAYAVSISSAAPGNIFVEGEPVSFTVKCGREPRLALRDFFGPQPLSGRPVARTSGRWEAALGKMPPGWYELSAADETSTRSLSFAVVLPGPEKWPPARGRIAIDAASAWQLTTNTLRAPLAKVVRRAGIPWVRERMAWTQVEPSPGRFKWKHYDKVVDAWAAEGIQVSMIWHDYPPWASRRADDGTTTPDDLRAVARFAREASRHFARRIQAWEIWNEPDGWFWPPSTDTLASFTKAASLGLAQGDPNALRVLGAICLGAHAFPVNLADCGIASYVANFNWHCYEDPSNYARRADAYRRYLPSFFESGQPSWLTEAGLCIPVRQPMDWSDLQRQARFAVRSAVLSLASGNSRHFLFLLLPCVENGQQWGVLNGDLSPTPAFPALSGAAKMIGEADYAGPVALDVPGAQGHLFTTGRSKIAVLWSETSCTIAPPHGFAGAVCRDMFGRERAADPARRIELTPEPIYLAAGATETTGARDVPLVHRPAAPVQPSPLVLRVWPRIAIEKLYACYRVQPAQQFVCDLDIYNLDPARKQTCALAFQGPPGWSASSDERSVTLGPGKRKSVQYRVIAPGRNEGMHKLAWTATDSEGRVERTVVYAQFADPGWPPQHEMPLAKSWVDASRWIANASTADTTGTTVSVWQAGTDAVGFDVVPAGGASPAEFEARFGDACLSSPLAQAPTAVNRASVSQTSGSRALVFDLESCEADHSATITLELYGPGGVVAQTEAPLLFGKRRVFVPLAAALEPGEATGARSTPPQLTGASLRFTGASQPSSFEIGHFMVITARGE